MCICLLGDKEGRGGESGDEAVQVDTEMRVIRRGRN